MFVCLYADDLIFTGINFSMIEYFKKSTEKKFQMTDLGPMDYFLGIEVKQDTDVVFISQVKYVQEIIKKFSM